MTSESPWTPLGPPYNRPLIYSFFTAPLPPIPMSLRVKN